MLMDISEGGAWIRGVPDLEAGDTGVMTIEGFDPSSTLCADAHVLTR